MISSTLQRHLDTYISLRRSLGFQMRVEPSLLGDFVRFIETHQGAGPIRANTAVEWAQTVSARSGPDGASRRLIMARGFLTYLRASLPETEVPDHKLVAAPRRPNPYVLTPQQIQTLIGAAQKATPRDSLRPHTLSTLLGVLASTGLRASEAIRLTVADVQLDGASPLLHIRETKFHKSRLVPLHVTAMEPLRHYRTLRTRLHAASFTDKFFVSELGHPLKSKSLGQWFTRLCRRLDIAPTDSGRRPTLHALRHAFAIERIRLWYQEGADVQALLPHLSVYLGHVRPQESYWYLTATPELLTAAADRFKRYAATGERL